MDLDAAGNRYLEFPMSAEESIRLPLIAQASWTPGSTIRIQKRTASGRLAPGPEFPSSHAGDFAKSLIRLIQE